MRRVDWSRSTTHSARNCYLCLRNNLLPMYPEWTLGKVVGARGFEPPTPRSRTECSTRLSHAPTAADCTRFRLPNPERGTGNTEPVQTLSSTPRTPDFFAQCAQQ